MLIQAEIWPARTPDWQPSKEVSGVSGGYRGRSLTVTDGRGLLLSIFLPEVTWDSVIEELQMVRQREGTKPCVTS